jgi:hypothetical protein
MAYFEENNPCDIQTGVVLGALGEIFPGIGAGDLRFLYHGTYNVFELRGGYIFKFPDRSLRNERGLDLIRRESSVLELLRPHVSVEIPSFEFISSDPGLPFVGYRKIEGVSLSRCYEDANRGQRLSVARRLGRFLSELHSPEVYRAYTARWPTGFTPDGYRRYWESYHRRLRETVYPRLTQTQREWVDRLFTEFLEDEGNFRFAPRVAHCDLDATNVLVDPSYFRVTGVIDFEEARVWDPAADLLFYGEGPKFRERLLSSYDLSTGPNLEQRTRFLRERAPLIYIQTGIDLGYSSMVDAGLEMLSMRMAESSDRNC